MTTTSGWTRDGWGLLWRSHNLSYDGWRYSIHRPLPKEGQK